MSAIKKTAKFTLYLFAFLVLCLIGGAIYLYINMNNIAKQMTEYVATDAMGVPVKIGGMDISLEELQVTVNNITIANPSGYKKSHAVKVGSVVVGVEDFAADILTLKQVLVDQTQVNLEVEKNGTNLSALKAIIDKKQAGVAKPKSSEKTVVASENAPQNFKVIVKKFSLTQAKLNPSVTFLNGDLTPVSVPDIHLRDIGKKENGVVAQEAIEQIMTALLTKFNSVAGQAGFLQGVSLDALKDLGQQNIDNIKDKVDSKIKEKLEAQGVTGGLDGLKGLLKQ